MQNPSILGILLLILGAFSITGLALPVNRAQDTPESFNEGEIPKDPKKQVRFDELPMRAVEAPMDPRYIFPGTFYRKPRPVVVEEDSFDPEKVPVVVKEKATKTELAIAAAYDASREPTREPTPEQHRLLKKLAKAPDSPYQGRSRAAREAWLTRLSDRMEAIPTKEGIELLKKASKEKSKQGLGPSGKDALDEIKKKEDERDREEGERLLQIWNEWVNSLKPL
ncbi:hypothetical protein FRB96_003862 [Tulasnella sp. 330]|nr:hypothetical protein FRB96_003862 [Tulasnella sp. 330]KAG8872143.1 hypothetical protein FRB97_008001 [Tulasnella sp. 331]KAG8875165.1 hypothetical protein FRB98_008053 [Tulasnella sp. 332]